MIAIIAGTGQLPLIAYQYLAAQGQQPLIIALFPDETVPGLHELGVKQQSIVPATVCKPSNILKILKQAHITQVLFAGKVDKRILLSKLSLDWLALKLLGKIATKGDRDIMEALVAELKQHSIETIHQDSLLQALQIPPGIVYDTEEPCTREDIRFGMDVARHMSAHDIGQTVLVKDRMIIAIEAIEGTDSCIARGIALAKNGITVCKTAHAHQNHKYDLPTIGPETIARIPANSIRALAWESAKTFIIDRKACLEMARTKNIRLVSV